MNGADAAEEKVREQRRTESDVDAVERRVLEVVGGLVAELGGLALQRPVAPRDSLDRDLGIGSLERVELLLRPSSHGSARGW
jgi:hypothetical protein